MEDLIAWRASLAPLAGLFGSMVLARRAGYDRGLFTVHAPPCQTLSVGGLEVGGSGKTPVAAYILQALHADKRHVGLLTRGYGRANKRLVVRRTGTPALAEELGDEPAMLVAAGLDVPVAAYGNRVVGAAALAALGCDTLVLDDGFSHRALGRHVDIVVLRGEQPFGNGHLMPWGSLREPPSSLSRAHVVWLHFRTQQPPSAPPKWTHALAPHAVCVMSCAVPDGPHDQGGNAVSLQGVTVVGAAGVARPDDFAANLTACGARVAHFCAFADHHVFTARDVLALRNHMHHAQARALVVTPKDAIKLAPLWPDKNLWVLGTRVQPTYGEDALRKILLSRHSL